MKHSEEKYADPPYPRDPRGRPDRFYRTLERLVPALERVSAMIGTASPPSPVDRDLEVTVARIDRPAEGVAALTLKPVGGAPLPAWQPGCHVDVVLPSGRVRQYSLCGDPADRGRYRIAVRRIPDGRGSGEVHELADGARLTLRGPRNAFPFARSERYLFVAGGIGITPILPMVRAAAHRRAEFCFVYTGRSRATMPFLDELPSVPGGDSGSRIDIRPDDELGQPDAETLVGDVAPGTAVYVCGPPPLIAAVRSALPDRPDIPLFWERFSPPPIVDGTAFEVELARSGQVLRVPADRTALDVISDVRPETPYSCRQGFCGTCRVRLLSGPADHRDRPTGGSSRREEIAICVSRSQGGRLRLDI
ncbi:oxidoreductase [Nocardiopsis gilva YIM 90087]|uniref:Oxidoreductase n=1 Tax=Nocardiopsis gilva YIM 90087 TaxID=1235441 RepID=A0A223SAR7_9ACTN|nr:PDR/VanB family oxidoreductase [Nocardiopsis gilva]ASU85176.1 oxidoreductase [Nocardiopsis gilva YIM 90087]